MIRVLICDDQAIARQGLQMILGSESDFEIVGAATNGAEAVEMVAETTPDIVLMDLKMPQMNGVEATRVVRERFPEVKVLVLTTFGTDEWVFDAIRSGAHGYLLKDAPPEQLFAAIRGTIEGQAHVDPNVAGLVLSQISKSPVSHESKVFEELSDRELQVLRLLAKGMSNTEIAKSIHLSEGTVRNYLSNIFLKLDVSDRTRAAIKAIRYGLIDLDEI